MDPSSELHVGVCAILGLPNVGKSTLLNRVLGLRLVAVSPRPQTTRNRILGVVNRPAADEQPGAQIIFLDTPGAQRGKGPLRRFMQGQAVSAAAECDVALVVVNASERDQQHPERWSPDDAAALADTMGRSDVPLILALNKIDRLSAKGELLPMMEAYHATGRYAEIVPISALKGDGVDVLQATIAARLPVGPALFPEEMYTDRAERFLAGELVREQLFRQLGKEVPYATAVVIEAFEDRRDRGDVLIRAVIHVERDSQKGIVVGRGGQRVKEIGSRAREAISELLGCPVHLILHVKVSPEWSRRDAGIRDMGYDE